MAVEKVNGPNNFSDKDVRKVGSPRIKPGAPSKPKSESPGRSAIQPPSEESDSHKLESLSLNDIVELSTNDALKPKSYGDLVDQIQEGGDQVDQVEISWRDPDVQQKISDLIELIRSKKEAISQRVEAARILLMERAYDNNEELKNTAEAILRGEQVDEISVDYAPELPS